MKLFIFKILKLFMILFLLSCIYYVLDDNFSPYYRHHEKLKSYTNSLNLHLENYDEKLNVHGDLVKILNFEPNIFREVYWKTDNYGFRNYIFHTDPDIIVFGDSHFQGFGTTQDSIFSELLQDELNLKVLNLAGSHPNLLFDLIDNKIIKKPRLVILERGERVANDVLGNSTSSKKFEINYLKYFPFLNKLYQSINKKYLHNSVIKNFLSNKNPYDNSMLFLDDYEKDNRSKVTNRTIKDLSYYKSRLDSLNMNFLFIPIPSKKTIFPHLAKNKNDIRYIKDLYKNLDILYIDYINLLEVFNKQSEIMYYLDDTHLNELGHKLIQNEASSFILKTKYFY